MIHKKLFGLTIMTALLTLVLVFLFIQFWGTPLRELMNGIAVLAIYGALMLGYLLGIALIFIGFIALYRFLWVRINDQNYKPVEV